MASAGDEEEQLCRCFKQFVKLSSAGKALSAEDEKLMNSKACGKMVKDCLPKQVQTIADASVFPKYKEKGKNHMHIDKFQPFIRSCAHEYAKIVTKNSKLPDTDEKVDKYDKEFKAKLLSSGPDVKQVKGSKTGNVEGLTDASKYTGAHKERFDESGKGKGLDGRVDKVDNTGYVGEYKGDGTFDKKQ